MVCVNKEKLKEFIRFKKKKILLLFDEVRGLRVEKGNRKGKQNIEKIRRGVCV
jgi:hypothetical protein